MTWSSNLRTPRWNRCPAALRVGESVHKQTDHQTQDHLKNRRAPSSAWSREAPAERGVSVPQGSLFTGVSPYLTDPGLFRGFGGASCKRPWRKATSRSKRSRSERELGGDEGTVR